MESPTPVLSPNFTDEITGSKNFLSRSHKSQYSQEPKGHGSTLSDEVLGQKVVLLKDEAIPA